MADGLANGLQRFVCCKCKRTFNLLTGTPFARLHAKEKWLPHLRLLRSRTPISQVASVLQVAESTALRWRHRLRAATPKQRRLLDVLRCELLHI